MKTIVVCLLVSFLQIAAGVTLSLADVYTWQDSRGVTHFTDNPESIPPAYRKKVRNRDMGESAPPAASESAPPVQSRVESSQPPAKAPSAEKEMSSWRNRYTVLRSELNGLKGGLDAKKEKMNDHRRKWLVTQKRAERQTVNQIEGEIARDEERIRELEKQLEALDVEAARNAVPLEWRK